MFFTTIDNSASIDLQRHSIPVFIKSYAKFGSSSDEGSETFEYLVISQKDIESNFLTYFAYPC